jgi:hypothetical protein
MIFLSASAERARHYDFGGNVCFFCRPFRNLPTPQEWQALISRILKLRQGTASIWR